MITKTKVQKCPNIAMHHKRVAGTLPHDANIEFVGIPATKEVIWFQYGNQHAFCNLPQTHLLALETRFKNDPAALFDISQMANDRIRQLELYTYFVYGDADFTPDIIDGVLQTAENYRHKQDCISLSWLSKDITIGSEPLNTRELKICDMILSDLPDKMMADKLGIALSTFDIHKRNLYQKAGVCSKGSFILKLIEERI